MIQGVSLFAAFIAGMLSVLPSCGPVLLPAFFANVFSYKKQLFVQNLIFALGFGVVFVPFGLGLRFLVGLLTVDAVLLHQILGGVLLVWTILSLLGWRFPGFTHNQIASKKIQFQIVRSFILGLTFGFTSGACSAPVLGAITTLAIAQQSYFTAFVLLLVFLVGMFVPLLVLALLIQRYGQRRLSQLFATGLKVELFGKEYKVSWANLISSILFLLLGVSFLFHLSLWSSLASKGFLEWFYRLNLELLR